MNTQAKHTPRPWRTYNMSKNKILKQWHIQRDDCKHDIALVSLDVAADERESVANLIAAAPAMYEALQAMLNGILFTRGASMSEDRWQTLTTIARTALSQAEGRQHE